MDKTEKKWTYSVSCPDCLNRAKEDSKEEYDLFSYEDEVTKEYPIK